MLRALVLFSSLLFIAISAVDARADGSGQIGFQHLQFVSPTEPPAEQNEERLKFNYDNRLQIRKTRFRDGSSSQWSLRTNLFFQASSLEEANEEQFFFDPTNIYLEYSKKNYYVQAGYFTLKWEGTDGMNPMDIASMKNWSDPLDSKTRASAGIHVGDSSKIIDWELVYIPKQTSSQLPGNTSAWWPRSSNLPLRTDNIELRLPDEVTYNVTPADELNKARAHNVALRIQKHADIADVAIAHYEGAAQTPLVTPTLNVTPIQVSPKEIYLLQSPIQLVPTDYRVRSTAGFISKAWDAWIFRASSRYDQPLGKAKSLTTWSQQTVAGFERSFDTIILVVQGLWFHSPTGGSLVSVQDVFDQSVLLGVRWQLSDTWTLLASGIQATQDSSSFYSLDISKSFESGWGLKASYQTLYGPKNSLLGVLDKNDRASFELTRAF